MQLGSGTYDLLPGITYTGKQQKYGWGMQYQATIRLNENSENYTLGDKHMLTGWASYRPTPWFSTSLRLSYQHEGNIDGMDSRIMAPVQTADPDNYGGNTLMAHWGLNWVGQSGYLRGHRIGLEYSRPIRQNLNGIQMEMQDMLTLGYQYAF
jgi:hypothetical protein